MASDSEFVLRTVEERGVRFVRLWFVDVLGLPKSISIPASELESALEDGIGVDGSSLEGSARLAERDVIAHPDPSTFQILPWRPSSLVARMFCDTRLPDDSPFPGDSREALRRVLSHAAELGWSFQVGVEIEFFLFAGVAELRTFRSRSTRAPTSISRRRTSAPTSVVARSSTSSRWASRSRPPTTRPRRPSTSSTSPTPTPSRWPTP